MVLDPEWLTAVREGVDAAVAAEHGLPEDLREQYAKRLEALDRKEGYFLDLAAEEEWPKHKLRERIDVIRREIADIQRAIEQADQRLDIGHGLMHDALALLRLASVVPPDSFPALKVMASSALHIVDAVSVWT